MRHLLISAFLFVSLAFAAVIVAELIGASEAQEVYSDYKATGETQ